MSDSTQAPSFTQVRKAVLGVLAGAGSKGVHARDLTQSVKLAMMKRNQAQPSDKMITAALRNLKIHPRGRTYYATSATSRWAPVVSLRCGHVAREHRPHRSKQCAVCGKSGSPTRFLVDGVGWLPIDRWVEISEAIAKSRNVVLTGHGMVESPESDRLTAEVLQHFRDDRLLDVAQRVYESCLGPVVLQSLRAKNANAADVLAWLLSVAESGVVPDRAWYAQYGVRAMSQAVGGRPTLTTADLAP